MMMFGTVGILLITNQGIVYIDFDFKENLTLQKEMDIQSISWGEGGNFIVSKFLFCRIMLPLVVNKVERGMVI